jgi:hypothetical protein
VNAAPKILIVEHEPQFGAWLRLHLEILYPETPPMALDPATLESRQDWLATQQFDLILCGVHVPEAASARRLDAAFAAVPALCADTRRRSSSRAEAAKPPRCARCALAPELPAAARAGCCA